MDYSLQIAEDLVYLLTDQMKVITETMRADVSDDTGSGSTFFVAPRVGHVGISHVVGLEVDARMLDFADLSFADGRNGQSMHRVLNIVEAEELSRELGFERTRVRRARLEFKPQSPPASFAAPRLRARSVVRETRWR
jgi:hypothetical protein